MTQRDHISADRVVSERFAQLHQASVEIRQYVFERDSEYLFTLNEYSISLRLPQARSKPHVAQFKQARAVPFKVIGTIAFVPARVAYNALIGTGASRTLVCRIARERFEAGSAQRYNWNDERFQACLFINDAAIRAYMLRIEEELLRPGRDSTALLEHLVALLIIDITRFLDRLADATVSARGRMSPQLLELIMRRIDDPAIPLPAMAELSALARIGSSRLQRMFKTQTGQTLGAVLAERKIARARELLCHGEHSIKEIAWLTGFAAVSGFSYAFHQATGESPRLYRLHHGAAHS